MSFNKSSPIDEQLSYYVQEKGKELKKHRLIILSGSIGIGKSTLLKHLIQNENYKLIQLKSDFDSLLPHLLPDNVLCIDMSNMQDLNLVLMKAITLSNKVVITSIEYAHLIFLPSWLAFIKHHMKKAKMRTLPIHLHITREGITEIELFS